MAAADNLLECSICLEWLDEPTILFCGHIFCLKHLTELVNKQTNQLKCPDCQRIHQVPNGDLSIFPRDYRLMEYMKSKVVIKRGQCKECNTEVNVSICDHCDQDICKECQESHKLVISSLLRRQLKEFARKFLQSETGDIAEDELKKKEENKEKIEENVKEINEECDHVIHLVEKRREELLTPFEKKLKKMAEMKLSMEFHQQIKNQLEKGDTTIKEMKHLKVNIAEKIKTSHEILYQSDEQIHDLKFVSFQSQSKYLYEMIANFGQTPLMSVGQYKVRDYSTYEVKGRIQEEEYGIFMGPMQ